MRIDVTCDVCGRSQADRRLSIDLTFWCLHCQQWQRPVPSEAVTAYMAHHWPKDGTQMSTTTP